MTDQGEWRPFHRTAQAAVVEHLRHEILTGQLQPGTRLIQSEFAARIGVSTTPVREAMRELVAQGLLEGDPHKGLFVHKPSLEELFEVYEIRLLLEPANMKKTALAISADQIASAQHLVDEMETETDATAWVVLNQRFHTILTDASGSTRFIDFLRNLRNISSLYVGIFARRTPERLAFANDEHSQMLEACRRRDADTAAEVVHHHILQTVEVIRDLLSERDGQIDVTVTAT